jgi:spermidine/putrescine-binding protein
MKNVSAMLSLAVMLFAVPVTAQDAKTIEAAKKEGGKVVIYGSLETPVLEGVMQAFRKKTGLNAEYWRASAMSVMNRAITEYRAGNPLFDVVLNNSDPLVIMAQDGMLAKYDSPTAKNIPAIKSSHASDRSRATVSSAWFTIRVSLNRKTRQRALRISSIRNTKASW